MNEQPKPEPVLPAPLMWTFDGPLATCLADAEHTLRRGLVLMGEVARIAVIVQVSLPALQQRVAAGDAVQPAWSQFIHRLSERYGLPLRPRVHHLPEPGPLVTLILGYRS